jgi:hypothetical protein
MRATTGGTTTDTRPIQRQIHMTSRATPRTTSRLPMTTLSQKDTHHAVKNTSRVIHLRGTIVMILVKFQTGIPHQITTKHALRPRILYTRSSDHPHRRLPSNLSPTSNSTMTLLTLARLANLSLLLTPTVLRYLHRIIKTSQLHPIRLSARMAILEVREIYVFYELRPHVPGRLSIRLSDQ